MLPDIAKEMAAALKTVPNNPHAELVTILEQWDGDHQINDIAPSVYYNMLVHAMSLAMKDELGESAYKSLMMTSILKNSYDMFFRAENSPWWDDVTTKDKKETRADIFDEAAKRTIASLHETSGPVVADWTWGKIHTLTHKHALDAVKPLAPYFNVGPFVVPGGSETINNLHFELDTDGYFQANGGPALRKIMDFSNVSLGDLYARVVLVATGSDYKKLGIPGEAEYYARGVHYCATCDGAFYRDKRLVVVGGGNSAVQEAMFLTRFATHIDLMVRSKLRASDVLQKELQKFVDQGKITVRLATTTDEIIGDADEDSHSSQRRPAPVQDEVAGPETLGEQEVDGVPPPALHMVRVDGG
jgi:hypothetical protein